MKRCGPDALLHPLVFVRVELRIAWFEVPKQPACLGAPHGSSCAAPARSAGNREPAHPPQRLLLSRYVHNGNGAGDEVSRPGDRRDSITMETNQMDP